MDKIVGRWVYLVNQKGLIHNRESLHEYLIFLKSNYVPRQKKKKVTVVSIVMDILKSWFKK